MDSLFSSFLNEVTNIKSNKMKKLEGNIGSPDEIIARILRTPYDPKQGKGSAWHILQISPDAEGTEVTKVYRKLSVLIHPDKCKNELASEAFQVLVKAYNDTKDPNYSDKFADVIQDAKNRVRKARKAENEQRAKKGEDPLDMEGQDFDRAVLEECDKMTTVCSEAASHSNSVAESNSKRLDVLAKERRERKKDEDKEKRAWERNKDKRAAGWQTFMHNIETKKFKTNTWKPVGQVGAADVHHKREERTEAQGKAEVDKEDKHIKRSDTQAGAVGIDRAYRQAWR